MTNTKTSCFPDRRDFHVNPRSLREGSLVRTAHLSAQGIHKAMVRYVFMRDGVNWAAGDGWELPETALEVIRAPLPAPKKWPVRHSAGFTVKA